MFKTSTRVGCCTCLQMQGPLRPEWLEMQMWRRLYRLYMMSFDEDISVLTLRIGTGWTRLNCFFRSNFATGSFHLLFRIRRDSWCMQPPRAWVENCWSISDLNQVLINGAGSAYNQGVWVHGVLNLDTQLFYGFEQTPWLWTGPDWWHPQTLEAVCHWSPFLKMSQCQTGSIPASSDTCV